MKLRIAGTIKESIVDGPGIRFVVFTQGCPHHCFGCHNPQSHDYNGGSEIEVAELVTQITSNPFVRALTISGGEPLIQIKPLIELLKLVKPYITNVILYTGYTYEEIMKFAKKQKSLITLLSYIDTLIDGPYHEEERDLSLLYRGSRNQRIIDVPKTLSTGNVTIREFKPF